MKINKFLLSFIIMFVTFTTVLSFSNTVSAKAISEYDEDDLQELQTENPFEMTFSEMALSIGDFVMEYLTFLLKEEVTVQKIIYNEVDALNANFFVNGENPSNAPATEFIVEAVNKWYDLLGRIVIIIYMMALVVVGIMTMLGRRWSKSESAGIVNKMDYGNCNILFFPIRNEICF